MLWEYKVLENGLNKGKIAMRFVLPSCFTTFTRLHLMIWKGRHFKMLTNRMADTFL